MKLNRLMLSTLIATTLLATGACKKKGCTDPTATNYSSEAKKNDGSCVYPPPTPTVNTPFTAKIDGVEFVEDDLTTSVSTWTQTLTIEAIKTNGKKVRLTMPTNIAVGTYTFTDPDMGSRSGYYNDGNSWYGASSGTGTLQIVSHNTSTKAISGIFSFTAQPYSFSNGSASYSVTSGQFMVNY